MKPEERPVQEFDISDALWTRIEPLLPERAKPAHPLGCHRPRVSDRKVLNSIFYLLRTGGQWQSLNSLDATRYAKRSTAHTRFQEWMEEGFFARLWEASLLDYDEMQGLDFEWMALDGAMTKAPLGGGKKRPQSLRPRQRRRQKESVDRSRGHPGGTGD
jgi:putative transposase